MGFSRETSCNFRGFAIFSSSHLSSSICHPFGVLLGSLLAPKMAETSLEIPLGLAKSRSRLFFFGLQALQERSRRPLRPLQDSSGRPRCSKKPPGSNLAPNLPPFWSQLGCKTQLSKPFNMLPAGLRASLQQYCKTAVLPICAGQATGRACANW